MRAKAFFFLLFGVHCVLAATFHVTSNGTDDAGADGSESHPWATLSHAIGVVTVQSGDTIKLGSGGFSEAGTIKVPQGVSIVGSGRDNTTLTLTSGDGPILDFTSSDHVEGNQTVRDLRFDGKDRTIKEAIQNHKVSNFSVMGCEFEDFSGAAVHVRGGWYGMIYTPVESDFITGIEIADVTFINCGRGDTYKGNCGGMMMLGFTKGALVHDVTMINHVNYSYGIKYSISCGGYNYGLKIYDCRFDIDGQFDIELFNAYNGCEVYNCTLKEISMGGNKIDPGPELDIRIHHNDLIQPKRHTCVESQMADIQIDHNYIVNGEISIWSAGGGLDRPTSAPYEVRRNYYIHNNVFTSTPDQDNIHSIFIYQTSAINGDPGPFEIFNNTFFNVKRAITIGLESTDWVTKACNVEIKNNTIKNALSGLCFWIKGHEGNAIENVDMRYNVFENVTDKVADFGGEITGFTNSNNMVGSPGLHGTGEKPSPFFTLAGENSLAYDAGVDVGLPFVGQAPDIGAYEVGAKTVIGNSEFSDDHTSIGNHAKQRAPLKGAGDALSVRRHPRGQWYDLQGRAVIQSGAASRIQTQPGAGVLISDRIDGNARRRIRVSGSR